MDIDTADIKQLVMSNSYFIAIAEVADDSSDDSDGSSDSDTGPAIEYRYYDLEGRHFNTVVAYSPFVVFRLQSGIIQLLPSYTVNYKGTETVALETDYIQAGSDALYYISDCILYRHEYDEEEPEEIDTDVLSFSVSEKFGRDYLVYEKADGVFAYRPDWDITPLDIDYIRIIGYTANSVITSDGVVVEAISNEPDILLNYPNNAYYTILSYQLATYFMAKQGGDVTILQAQLEKAKFDFEDNAQDAFTYPRIKNVY